MSTTTIEAESGIAQNSTTEERTCRLNTSEEGEALGVTVFLSPEQLQDLGIDVEETDSLSYKVENGEVVLSETENTI